MAKKIAIYFFAILVFLFSAGPLLFESPDMRRFPCLGLAYEALEAGGAAPAVLNTMEGAIESGEYAADRINREQ